MPPGRSPFVQIFPDAADEGIRLVSHKTGREARFYVDRTDEMDGDVRGWHLKPTSDTLRREPGLRGVEVLLIND